MNRFWLSPVAILLTSLLVCAAGFGSGRSTDDNSVRSSMIVSTAWLAKHLDDSSLVLLQVGEKSEYVTAHIPRAQYIALTDLSKPKGGGLTLELPDASQLRTVFEKLGVSDKSHVVVYFSKDWVTPTARVFFTLDYLGLGEQASILDGGLPAWTAEGRTVTSEVVQPKPGHISVHAKTDVVVDVDWVKQNLTNKGTRILDARAPQFYSGAEVGRMPRGGHIPGAVNIPFSTLVTDPDNKFKSADALRTLFSQAGVAKGERVATYCHVGQQASLLYFAARYLGYETHLYDGSFEEWSHRTELPVEKSVAEKSKEKP